MSNTIMKLIIIFRTILTKTKSKLISQENQVNRNLKFGIEEYEMRESGVREFKNSEILNTLNLGTRRSENQIRFHKSMNPPI